MTQHPFPRPRLRPRLLPAVAGTAGLAVLAGAMLGGSAANAATTTVAVPAAPDGQFLQGYWGGDDPTIPVSATAIEFVLPASTSSWGLTSLDYSLTLHGGQDVDGTAAIGPDRTVSIPLPAGSLVAQDHDEFLLSAQQDGSGQGAPSPTRSVSLGGAFVPSAAATTNVIDLDSAAAGQGYGLENDYSVAQQTPITLRAGDSITLQSPSAGVFSGAITAGVLASASSRNEAAPTTTLSADGTALTVTIPANADLSDFVGVDSYLDVNVDNGAPSAGARDTYSDIEVPVTLAGPGTAPVVSRVSGSGRYETSVALAKKGYPDFAQTVFVATGTNFPDALGAASAAAQEGGPLLLTDPTTLPTVVSDEIKSLTPTKIVVVGGPAAVSDAVFSALGKIAPTVRLAGGSRYETDQAVTSDAFGTSASEVYIATGLNYPDALSASAAAGAAGEPVVLVNGSAPSLDPGTRAFLAKLGATSFRIAGGTSAVSPGVAADLAKLGTVTRYAGSGRYETSQLINQAAFPNAKRVYAATGTGFADALSGAALAASDRSPLYVVQPTCIPAADAATFTSAAAVTLIGGTSALSANVAALGRCS